MRAREDATLPAIPPVVRWKAGAGKITPLQAAAELLDAAERMPPGPEGEAFRRAAALAVECLGAFHPDLMKLEAEPDMVLDSPYRKLTVSGKILGSVRSFVRAHCEYSNGATVKLSALFGPWHERWLAAGNAKTRADVFYEAAATAFPGVEKRCRGSGNWIIGLRMKTNAADADDAEEPMPGPKPRPAVVPPAAMDAPQKPADDGPPLLSVREAAKLLGVGRNNTIPRLIERGSLKPVLVGSRQYIPREQLIALATYGERP